MPSFTIHYSEYLEYEEDVEASTIDEAKKQFELAVDDGQVEPVTAKILEYKVVPDITA